MSDPAVAAPPPAARASVIAREVRRQRIMERARRRWRCDQRVRTAADDRPAAAARGEPDGGAPGPPRGRNARGAPAFDVEAPFGLVPTLAAAGAFEPRKARAPRGRKELPTRPQAVGIPYISCARNTPLPKLSKRLQNTFQTPSRSFQTLPKASKTFQKFPGLGDAAGWRAGRAIGRAAPVGFVASDGAARTFRRDGNRA
jgi:hypothetical protein